MSESHPNARLEAFCDGVFAIALTLLIIDVSIPSTTIIHSNADFLVALKDLAPSIFAFVLSFVIIFITWVNHHNTLKLVHRSSASFIYANGLLLLAVVFLPFPTSLLGGYLFSDHAAPAVIFYNAVLALQSIGWIFLCRTILSGHLVGSERLTTKIRQTLKYASYAFIIYSSFAIIALWFPLSAATLTTLTWVFWLIYGITLKGED